MTASPDREYWEDRALKHGQLASGYLDAWNEAYEQPLRWAAFKRICPIGPGLRVLDVGCGSGRWSVPIAELGAQVLGADLSARMIEMATPHPRVEYRVAAADELECPDGYFDVEVSFTVLQHITNPEELHRALRNLRRMLKASGRFFVLEYSPLTTLPSRELSYIRYRTHSQWIELFAHAGFKLRASTGVGFVGRRAHSVWRKLRRATPANGVSAGDVRLISALQAVERGVSTVPLLRHRSDLHAYVFVKDGGAS